MGLKETLRRYVNSPKAGVSSPEQLESELKSIKSRSSRVLSLCCFLIAAVIFVTLYFTVLKDDFEQFGALLAADGVIIATLCELVRRSYRDMIGSSYILSMAAVSSEAQISDIISEILKSHFGE